MMRLSLLSLNWKMTRACPSRTAKYIFLFVRAVFLHFALTFSRIPLHGYLLTSNIQLLVFQKMPNFTCCGLLTQASSMLVLQGSSMKSLPSLNHPYSSLWLYKNPRQNYSENLENRLSMSRANSVRHDCDNFELARESSPPSFILRNPNRIVGPISYE